jgi:hypothetical protein
MKLRTVLPLAVVAPVALAVASLVAQAPAPAAPQAPGSGPGGVQVAVPAGSAEDQQRQAAVQKARAAERAKLAALPIPRRADGRIELGSSAAGKGVWLPGAGNLGITNPPYQPWTRAVSADRRRMELEPHTRCKPSGGPRQFLTPYGAEIVDIPDLQQVFIFDIGGPHSYRTIYMDGRPHPDKLTPTYYGHSTGKWEGDTLVVDTVGFNEDFWLDRGNMPHTSALHLIEKFTRTAFDTMRYELTVDDPGAYTATFSGTSNLRWEPNTELFEYVCQQQNYAPLLMVGQGTKVDRTSEIVP